MRGWQLWWHDGADVIVVLGTVSSRIRVSSGLDERDGGAVSRWSVCAGGCGGVQQLPCREVRQLQWAYHGELQRVVQCRVLRQRVWTDDVVVQRRVSSGVCVCGRVGEPGGVRSGAVCDCGVVGVCGLSCWVLR